MSASRYSDNALLRWSSICLALDLARCWVSYWIDGRRVADQALVGPSGHLSHALRPPQSHYLATRSAPGQTSALARLLPGLDKSPASGVARTW